MREQKVVGWVMAVLFVLVGGVESSAQEESGAEDGGELPEAEEVVEKLDTLYRSESSHAVMTMKVEKPRNSRELELESWSKGEERMLVVIRKPAREAGTATLRTPDGLWNYLPRADRLMRIPSGLLSDNWMGSHFSNEDLMREANYDEDYDATIDRAELEGEEVLEVTLTAASDAPVVYSKLVFYVSSEAWTPLEQEFYDDGEVVRRMEFSNVGKVGGKKIPKTMTLRPSDSDEYTRVTYEELEFGVDLNDRLFSKRGLRRRAK